MWQCSVSIYPHTEFHETQYQCERNVYYGSGIGEGNGVVERVLCHFFQCHWDKAGGWISKPNRVYISLLIRKIM